MPTTVTSSKPKRVHTKKSTTVAGLDLKTASMQDVFDFVVFKLIQQGKQSLSADGWCKYLSADGCKCAIGQIIPDGLYVEGFEGRAVSQLLYAVHPVLGGLNTPTSFLRQLGGWVAAEPKRADFLSLLQNAHDVRASSKETGSWLLAFRSRARALATTFGLDSSIVGYRESVQAGTQAGTQAKGYTPNFPSV